MPEPMPPVQATENSASEGHRSSELAMGVLARHESQDSADAHCACGCGRIITRPLTGRPPRFATSACRAAGYRRRFAGLGESEIPRQGNHHGRRRLESLRCE
jgi:hypothetical protein